MVDIAQIYADNLAPLDVVMRMSMVTLYLVVMTITPVILVLEGYFLAKAEHAKEARRKYSRCLDLLFWINIACFVLYFAIRFVEMSRVCSNTNTIDRFREMYSLCTNVTKP